MIRLVPEFSDLLPQFATKTTKAGDKISGQAVAASAEQSRQESRQCSRHEGALTAAPIPVIVLPQCLERRRDRLAERRRCHR